MKLQNLSRVLLSVLILGTAAYTQQAKAKSTSTQKFFEVDKNIEDLRKELATLRQKIRELEVRTSVPEIRKEINKLVQAPEISHEIVLKNGTVVKGKIIHEDLDKIIVQTIIGQLTISKNEVKLSREAEKPRAKCILDGPVIPKVFEDKITYSGRIKNDGLRRADFPMIRFQLFDEGTRMIATDSVVVAGNFHMFVTGVQTDATIEPGQSFPFECTISIPTNAKISYYIPQLSWDEFE